MGVTPATPMPTTPTTPPPSLDGEWVRLTGSPISSGLSAFMFLSLLPSYIQAQDIASGSGDHNVISLLLECFGGCKVGQSVIYFLILF